LREAEPSHSWIFFVFSNSTLFIFQLFFSFKYLFISLGWILVTSFISAILHFLSSQTATAILSLPLLIFVTITLDLALVQDSYTKIGWKISLSKFLISSKSNQC
jgi:hypothetical protein